MIASANQLHVNEARVAAAAGVVMDSWGLSAGEAFEWIMDESAITGIPMLEVADLVVREACWESLYPSPSLSWR